LGLVVFFDDTFRCDAQLKIDLRFLITCSNGAQI